MMVTDPPYGVEYDATWRAASGMHRAGSNPKTGNVQNDNQADWGDAWALFRGNVAYVWHSMKNAATLGANLMAEGFELKSQIIWNKNRLALGRSDYHWKHEPCLYAVRKGAERCWVGARDKTTVWDIMRASDFDEDTEDTNTSHGTQKPVECMARPIRNHGKRGDAIYEPFSGSGTTVIACEQEGRRCYAMEIHPPYVDMAVERWERFTGQTAVLVRSCDG
jgi:DNA modification methylase